MAEQKRSRTQSVGDHQPIREEEELTIEEIIDRHLDSWVLMRVTGHDEDHWPAKGFVIATAATQREADAVLDGMFEANPKPRREGRPLYAFWAWPEPSLAEFEAFLQERLSSAKPPA